MKLIDGPEFSMRTQCGGCGWLLELEATDVYRDPIYGTATFRCIACGSDQHLPEAILSDEMQRFTRDRFRNG